MLSSSSFNRLCLLPLFTLLWASPASAVPVSFSGHFLGPSDATVDRYESIGISAITGLRAAEMDGALINAFLDEGRGLGFDPNELPGYGVPVIGPCVPDRGAQSAGCDHGGGQHRSGWPR